jgi:hypothetical protein
VIPVDAGGNEAELLAEFATGFPWGVLLISDARSKEQIPSWSTPDDQVAVAATALVVRVMHRDNGEVAVRVWDDALKSEGDLAFAGSLAVPSRILRLSDALGERAVEVDVPAGGADVRILTDHPSEASRVDVVLTAWK